MGGFDYKLKYEEQFYQWLLTQNNIPNKVARNIISRCRRTENIIDDKIFNYYKSNKISELFEELRSYAYKDKDSKSIKSIYTLHATLRHSVKKYLKFLSLYV